MFWTHVRPGDYHGCAVVELHGELDIATGVSAWGLLATVTASEKVTIVDLAKLEFMDCSGLGALVRARAHAGSAGHALLLAAPAAAIRQVLEMTGAARLFSTHPSLAAAADCGIKLLIGG
jgi:anti-sigma B factor antagonist